MQKYYLLIILRNFFLACVFIIGTIAIVASGGGGGGETPLTTWYSDSDGDGDGRPNKSIQAGSQPDGYVIDNTDCDDTDPSINPAATEVCDGKDNDCDGEVDEGVLNACGECGQVPMEVCDGKDNDCDGSIDEGVKNTYYLDYDEDGYGDVDETTQACSPPDGYVENNSDCDDDDPGVHPDATEICEDGIDQDCDDEVDEDGCVPPRFTDMYNGTVRENDSGLTWLKDASCSDLAGTDEEGRATWSTANNAADILSDYTCGLTAGSSAGAGDGWRLPTQEEWEAFVDKSYTSPPALSNEKGTAQWTEGDVFEGVKSSFYWSSTENTLTSVWSMDMASGDMDYEPKTGSLYVWPVNCFLCDGGPYRPYESLLIGDSIGRDTDFETINGNIADVCQRVAGIGGQTLDEIRGRFNTDVVEANPKPSIVIIQGGVNDLTNANNDLTDDMIADVTAMVDAADAAGVKIIVVNIGPWEGFVGGDGRMHTPYRQTLTDRYNLKLAAYTTANSIEFVDIYTLLEDKDNPDALDPIYDSSDHLHPSDDGYTKMAKAYITAINNEI